MNEESSRDSPLAGSEGRLALTLGLVAVYCGLRSIWLPVIDIETLKGFTGHLDRGPGDAFFGRSGVLSLGIMPFVVGYMLTELFSVSNPWGQKLRRSGQAGREVLDRWALRISIMVAMVQAAGVMVSFGQMRSATGLAILPPGPGPWWMGWLSLVTGAVLTYGLARWISERGFGNGFCVLIAVDLLAFPLAVALDRNAYPRTGEELIATGATLVVAFGLFAGLERTRGSYQVRGIESPGAPWVVGLPALPQGIVAVQWASTVPALLVTLGALGGIDLLVVEPGTASYYIALAIGLLGLSRATFWLFGSRERIEQALEPLDGEAPRQSHRIEAPALGGFLRHRARLIDIVLLALLLGTTYLAQRPHGILIGAVGALMLAAIFFDGREELSFRRRFPNAVPAMDLHNVHLAHMLRARLQAKDIPTLIQTRRYRSLFYFFAPLFTLRIWVAEEHREAALTELEEIHPSRI